MQRGTPRPGRDAEVVRPHRPGGAASSCSGALAGFALPAVALPGTAVELFGLAVAIFGVVFGIMLWVRRVQAEVRAAEGLPFLIPRRRGPTIVGADPEPSAPRRAADVMELRPRPAIGPIASAAATPPSLLHPAAARGNGVGRAAATSLVRAAGAEATPESPAVPLAGGVHAILVAPAADAASLMPADATLQFLPGRLEFAGGERRPDIRFVRQPGPVTEVTVGRRPGPVDRHVMLAAPTVSRLHARLRFEGGRWTIANLSRTNPVRVNGRLVAGPRVLGEGDRVEVGEFLLVFRER